MKDVSAGGDADAWFEKAKFDPRTKYPCCKSFDEFIDVRRLRSLDGYIAERIEQHVKSEKDACFLKLLRLGSAMPCRPGAREIRFTRPRPGTMKRRKIEKAKCLLAAEKMALFRLSAFSFA